MISLDSALSKDYIVSKAIAGVHLPTVWPSLNHQQRMVFAQDFADFFIGTANCGIPPDVMARQQLEFMGASSTALSMGALSTALPTAKEIIVQEMEWRFLDEPELYTRFYALLDRLIDAHPNPTDESLERLTLDQDDWWKIEGGNILVDPGTGHINAVLGKAFSLHAVERTAKDSLR